MIHGNTIILLFYNNMNLSEAMNMHISLENKYRFVKKFQEMLTFTYI